MVRPFIVAAISLALGACAPGVEDSFARNCGGAQDVAAPDQHGTPARNDGPVEVGSDGGGFYARRVVTLSNGFGGAIRAEVEFATVNGAVLSCAIARGGYGIQVHLEGRGATEQEARDALATMTVRHEDVLAADLIRLATRVEFGESVAGSTLPLPLPVNVGDGGRRQRAASIFAALPAAPAYVFGHTATNGLVQSSGFHGTAAALSSTNGGVALDGAWDQASLDVTNGPIHLAGDFAGVTADATNGPIYASLATARNVDGSFNATNSSIDVALARNAAAGFDLRADTTNGRAVIRVAGAQPQGEQQPNSAHHRTSDYDSRAVKVSVDADATNGDVTIHD